MYGIQRIHLLRNCMILAGAGVGGGSLNYANTLYVPPEPFFDDAQWAHITDWRAELMPHYDQAHRMLGVVTNPTFTDADRILKEVADDMGVGDTFVPTPVGVFFGEDGKKAPGKTVPDPYFGGAGPARTGCIECGSCMTGCRYGAKNTLLKNYLGLAESAGAEVIPMTTVTSFDQRPDGSWNVETVSTGRWLRKKKRTYTASNGDPRRRHLGHPAAAVQDARHRPAAASCPTSSACSPEPTPSRSSVPAGCEVAPTTSISRTAWPSPRRSTRPTRHPHRAVPLRQGLQRDGPAADVDDRRRGSAGGTRRAALEAADPDRAEPTRRARCGCSIPRRWSERTMIALVMQNLDNSITTYTKRSKLGFRRMVSKQGHGEPNPTWIPAGNEVTRRIAKKIDGVAGGTWGELFNIPLTAHFLGGAVIGDSVEHGVIDPYHRVHGYPTLYVVDGAAISANLGVNPSLTITAQAERAASLWPNKGEVDLRPAQGAGRIGGCDPIAPAHPGGARRTRPRRCAGMPIEPRRSTGADPHRRRGAGRADASTLATRLGRWKRHHPGPCWWSTSERSTRS